MSVSGIGQNPYQNNAAFYTATVDEGASKHQGDRKIKSGANSGTNKDTVSISVAGQQYAAERAVSDSEMDSMKITSELDSFRSGIKSMNEPLPVNWKGWVDPYGIISGFAKAESRLRQLADPAASKKDEDMEKAAEEYAKSKIDMLIEKKKAMLDSGTAKSSGEEYDEYRTAYDAYHSEKGGSLISMMAGDTKKAYNIYKDIIDGTTVSMEDREFLVLHNFSMYRGAVDEYIRKTEDLYNAKNGNYTGH